LRWFKLSVVLMSLGISGLAQASDGTRSPSTSRPASSSGNKAGDLVFTENSFDFGRAVRGQILTHVFNFKNTGSQVLRILGVHASCGCTLVEVNQEKQYAPGESGTVKVALDTTNFTGAIVKTVTIMTSEALLPDRILTMRVMIDEEFVVDPPLVDFGEVFAQDSPTRIVNISPVRDSKTELVSVSQSGSGIVSSIIPPKGSEAWRVSVQLNPNQKPGTFKDTLTIKNTSKHLPNLQVMVRAQVRKQISTSPEYLEFGAVAKKQQMERAITLMSRIPFTVSAPKVELLINGEPVADVSKLVQFEVKDGDRTNQQIKIRILNESERSGTVHGKIKMQTSDRIQKEVELNFYAFFTNKEESK
jgi:Protein of unknown function (DUF1573)